LFYTKLNAFPKKKKPWRTNDVCLYYKTRAEILGKKTNSDERIGSKKVSEAESHDANLHLRITKLKFQQPRPPRIWGINFVQSDVKPEKAVGS
jgi:hypothetical protein